MQSAVLSILEHNRPGARLLFQVLTQVRINEGYEEPDIKATTLEPGFQLMNCSKDYMHTHFAAGDNPKHNPWGDLPLDIASQRDKYPEAVAKLQKSKKPACRIRFQQVAFATTEFGAQFVRKNICA